MTGSLTGLELFHNKFDLPLSQVLHTEGRDIIAAFIGEPVLGTGGIVPPPAGYWPAIQAVLKKYDILLIAYVWSQVSGALRGGKRFRDPIVQAGHW